MPDDAINSSSPSDPVDVDVDLEANAAKEDADTAAARKELKHTVISDTAQPWSQGSVKDAPARPDTPESDPPDAQNESLKDQVSSPKKKRAHDQVEDDHDQDQTDAKSDVSTDSAKHRAARAEPEKKRPRDELPQDTETSAVSQLPTGLRP
jgi:Ran-binding protein 3